MRDPKGFIIKGNTFVLAYLFLLVILSVFTLSPIMGERDKNPIQRKNNIDFPLRIIGNEQLIQYAATYDWLGNGTQIDPIVIRDSLFDGQGSKSALSIQQTNLNLLIEGCRFTGSTGERIYPNPKPAGLQLVECTNIQIQGTQFDLNYGNGLYIKNCTHIKINNCVVFNNSNNGIYLYECTYTLVTNCTIEYNDWHGVDYTGYQQNSYNVIENCIVQGNHWHGIGMGWGGVNNLIRNCMVKENWETGVILGGVNNSVCNNSFTRNREGDLQIEASGGVNILRNNSFQEGGGIIAPVDEYYLGESTVDIVEENYVAGRPIIFLHDVSEYLFPKNPGQVILHECGDLQITNVNFEHAYCGLYIGGCERIIVQGCNFFNNTYSGISVEISTSTEIVECAFNENRGYGVYTENSIATIVQGNYFFDNLDGGFHLNYESDDTVIFQDNVLRNDGVFFSHITPETTIENNTINGKALVVLIEEKGLQFNNTENVGQFILFRCNQIQFRNIHFQNTNTPVILVASSDIRFLNCSFANSQRGIYSKGGLAGAWEYFWANRNDNIHIENCSFKNIRLAALTFLFTLEIKVINTIVEGENSAGFVDKWTYGISLSKSEISLISGCKISNFAIGIFIRSDSHDHLVTNCTLTQCHKWGICLGTIVWDNVITYNNFIGVSVADGSYSSKASDPRNTFIHNYWSESDHSDENNDGYADHPYLIDTGRPDLPDSFNNNYDSYPLVKPSKFSYEVFEGSHTATTESTGLRGTASYLLALLGIIFMMRIKSK